MTTFYHMLEHNRESDLDTLLMGIAAKPPGEGTGRGLSVSYFIITENHNENMEIKSTSGLKTWFAIRLPIDLKRVRNA